MLSRCSYSNYLAIYFVDVNARANVIRIAERDLKDSPHRIAEYINDLKARSSAGSIF